MLLHVFPSMFVSSLREFPESCVYKHGGLNCFIEYLQRKLLTTNFFSDDIESAKKSAFYLHFKTIHFLFYNYIFMYIILAKKLLNILAQISYFLC
jgi:hypothetical protein